MAAPALRPLEVVCGLPFGFDPVDPIEPGRWRDPRLALEQVLAEALARPPCLMSFSGGRDSSALLAVAVQVARRQGLPMPIPATLVFPGSAAADEAEWQRIVLDHLGVDEQVRIEVDDELGAVGPVADGLLRQVGLLWPFNSHFHLPIIERAAGGTVVTGFGGDELALSSATANAERLLSTWRRRHHLTDALVMGLALSPRPVRRAVRRHRAARSVGTMPWFTAEATRRYLRSWPEAEANFPLGWDRTLREYVPRDRYFRVCIGSFETMGALHDVAVVHPFVSAPVLDGLASVGGFRGLGSRSELMARLFGDVLPEALVTRQSKASFTDPLWTPGTVRFACHEWSGDGVDAELVDVAALRNHWATEHRNLLSTTLLQQAWMHQHGYGPASAGPGPSS